MESNDIFSVVTAPLTFHDFLDRMRHPSAADLVRSIKSFLVQFLANSPDPDKDSSSVQELLRKTEGAFRAHPLWLRASEEELESAGEGLEKYLMTKLFSRAFPQSSKDCELDQQLSEKMSRLQQHIRPEHLDISLTPQSESALLLAQKELQKMNTYKAPRDKLVCILNCCRVVNNTLLNESIATNDNSPGADDFFPVLVYVVVKANPPQLHSNLLYIQRYRLHSRLVSEAAYFYTNLVSAATFIQNLTAASLTIDPEEFERIMLGESYSPDKIGEVASTDVVDQGGSLLQQSTGSAEGEQQLSTREVDMVEANKMALTTPTTTSAMFAPSTSLGNAKTEDGGRHLSVSDLDEKGASAVVEADRSGESLTDYRFLYARSGDLMVKDVMELLMDYKKLVLRYVALSKAVEAARPVSSAATQIDPVEVEIAQPFKSEHEEMGASREEVLADSSKGQLFGVSAANVPSGDQDNETVGSSQEEVIAFERLDVYTTSHDESPRDGIPTSSDVDQEAGTAGAAEVSDTS